MIPERAYLQTLTMHGFIPYYMQPFFHVAHVVECLVGAYLEIQNGMSSPSFDFIKWCISGD